MFRTILIAISYLTFSACQAPTPAPTSNGGSVVGNGIFKYQDPANQFSFEYNQSLTLSTPVPGVVVVENAELARALNRPISKIEFSEFELSNFKKDDFLAHIRSLHPEKTWETKSQNGVTVVFFNSETPTRIDSHYFYYMNSRKALEVTLNAVSEAEGIRLMKPVIDSISFDTESPVIHELFFEPSTIKAGETAKLKFRATDKFGKISGTSPSGSVDVLLDQKCRELITEEWVAVETCGEFRSIGNDWYEIDVPTSPGMLAGKYVLFPMTIWDASGNPKHIVAKHESGVWHASMGNEQEDIRLNYLTVTNSNPKASGPVLSNLRFEPKEIRAGESATLVFDAKDDEPEFKPGFVCDFARHIKYFEYGAAEDEELEKLEPTEYAIPFCGTPQKRDDGSWSIPFDTLTFLPSGPYIVVFRIQDSSSNGSNILTANIRVSNEGPIDTKGPQLLAIKPDRESYRQGESGSMMFQATDDLSGLAPPPPAGSIKGCRFTLKLADSGSDDVNNQWRIRLCESDLRIVEDGWYAISFTLGDNIPPGTYVLETFSVVDRINNRITYRPQKDETGKLTYWSKFYNEDTGLPILTIQVKPR